MTIRHMRIFAAVCEYKGATNAAKALHVVQPVVSNAISELEGYYGVHLFERINQRLVLTEKGKELLVKAKDIIARFDDFEQMAREGSERPTIRIGCSLTIARCCLAKITRTIGEKYPKIDLRITVNKTYEIENMLMKGDLDFGMIEDKISTVGLRATAFSSDRLTAVCAPDYDFPQSTDIATLSKQRLLLRDRGSASRDMLDRLFAAHRVNADPIMVSASNSALVAACEAGFGIAVQPELLVRDRIADGRLREIAISDADLSREFYIVLHKNKRLTGIQSETVGICASCGSLASPR